MENKITLSLFYMGLFSAFVSIVLTGVAFYNSFQVEIEKSLQSSTALVLAAYDENGSSSQLDRYAQQDLRLTLISPDGTVLFDSVANPSSMDNHLNRPEVQQALESGSGKSHRQSATLGTDDYYYAVLLTDGNILRASVAVSNILQAFGQAYPSLILALVFITVLTVIFTLILTQHLIRPIKALARDMDDPGLANDPKRVYPELVPFVLEIQNQRATREQMRQEFTANVSHELKTPLTSISGYAEMIETGLAKPEDVKRFAATIQKEAGRMLALISDIIRLSRLDEVGGDMRRVPVDLYSVAQECAESLATVAGKRGIRITAEGSSSVVESDPDQVWELIFNLADNAVRYNRDNGSVSILVAPGKVTVKDTGIGIPKTHQSRIFERFYRVDKSRSKATGGTGLGLSIVKHIVELNHAEIQISSTVNVGTEITVLFPPLSYT